MRVQKVQPVNNISPNTVIARNPSKVGAFIALWKPRLSFLVAFSSAFGYLLGTQGIVNWQVVIFLFVGGFLISGASVTINQILEVKYDKLMSRTKNRPLPSKKLVSKEALYFAILSLVAGMIILWLTTNPMTVALSIISLVLYAFVYTPLKRVGPVAVFVGAIPGALPPLIGWVAATGTISYMGLIIFGIQFIWQFPHFWAIAWVADEDYRKAGFRLLPNGGRKDLNTAFQIMIYTLFLLPISLLPAWFGLTGINSAFIVVVCGALFLSQTFRLMQKQDHRAAKNLMFGSFIYLPVVQLAFILDKI